MTQDRLEALRALQRDAAALADKAKAAGLDAAAVDQLAATVADGLTEAAVKVQAPDSWRVTVRTHVVIPVDTVCEVIGETPGDARYNAELDAYKGNMNSAPEGGGVWLQNFVRPDKSCVAIRAEPVWDVPPAKVEAVTLSAAEVRDIRDTLEEEKRAS